MADVREEDLFAHSTMSFGEHLEALRMALFRAVAGLAIGMLVGFYFGEDVVAIITRPLEKSLKTYYESGAVLEYAKFLEDQKAAGLDPPYTLAEVKHLVDVKHQTFTIYKVHRKELRKALGLESKADKAVVLAPGAAPAGANAKSEETATEDGSQIDKEPFVSLFVWRPIDADDRVSIKTLNPTEAFMIWLKASFMAGFVLASPWIFWQLWGFVAAGLYPNEKRYVHVFLPVSIGLFLSGAVLCFFYAFPLILEYLFKFNRASGFTPDLRINEWLGFALLLPIGFGLSFQLPLVMLFLNRIGLLSIDTYWRKWRISVLVVFVLSMFLTPGDPYSMLAMAIPLTGLYFVGILLCQWSRPRKNLLEQ